jgi:predicted O-linked N-acetylglucosamine transferase (SPINDLY family)
MNIPDFNFQFQAAVALQNSGRLPEAAAACQALLKTYPGRFDAIYLLAVVYAQQGALESAIETFRRAIQINSKHAQARYNLAYALNLIGDDEGALKEYRRVLKIEPGNIDAINNMANTLFKLDRLEDAVGAFKELLSLSPHSAEAYYNLAVVLARLQRHDEVLAASDKAIALKPDYATAYFNRASTLHILGRFEEALADYEKAQKLDPKIDFLPGYISHLHMRICDWAQFDVETARIVERTEKSEAVSPPFAILSIAQSRHVHRRAGELWAGVKFSGLDPGPALRYPRRSKIRLGYFSADFQAHATAWLAAGLFEKHDRAQFELSAFSFGPPSEDAERQRLRKAFDHFVDASAMSEMEIAERSRSMQIDIAVDLKGFTNEARTAIFALRAAPIQMNYLGYPGTMGSDFIDYIVADPTLIPPAHRQDYSEKIIYLPNSYQPNDRQRAISERIFTRKELGLPEDKFVFCCFNNNFKITPHVFDLWARILNNAEASVLWLIEDNAVAANNLRKEAASRGVAPERLIFAQRLPMAEHLARQRLADLFLDTLPYNAHTTASDALWAGLPLLTQIGETFPGRVSASLLTALDVPELIASSEPQYENLAIELAGNPAELSAIRRKIEGHRLTKPLFDTALYTKHLERAFKAAHDRHHGGLPPDHIFVDS